MVAYFSRALSTAKRNYCVTRRELLAVVAALQHFHHYLYGWLFTIWTDHALLTWLQNFKEPEGQLACWLEQIQDYEFTIQHRTLRLHGNADALSRWPCLESHCQHCQQANGWVPAETEFRRMTASSPEILPQRSEEQVRAEQEADHTLSQVWGWVQASQRPDHQAIFDCSPEVKSLYAQWSSLTFQPAVPPLEKAEWPGDILKLLVPRTLLEWYWGWCKGKRGVNTSASTKRCTGCRGALLLAHLSHRQQIVCAPLRHMHCKKGDLAAVTCAPARLSGGDTYGTCGGGHSRPGSTLH